MQLSTHLRLLGVASTALLGAAASTSLADQTYVTGSVFNSINHFGASFSAFFDYSALTPTSGELIINIANNTPIEVGGYLTGFLFRMDTLDPMATATLVSTTDPDFLNLGVHTAPPWGEFDGGAALGADWEGGGHTPDGIPVGMNATFAFAISANDAMNLTADDFAHTLDYPSFVVRFRGLLIGDSDKVPAKRYECDWNDDGFLNSQDYFDYVTDFFSGTGEYNQDGVLNSQDYFDFLLCFFSGGV